MKLLTEANRKQATAQSNQSCYHNKNLGPRRPPTPDVGNRRWTNPKKTTSIFDTIYISIHQTPDLKTRVISPTPMARWTPITHRNSRDL
ncbi:hypothetical protein YC2023_036114 [Brassica napus]